MNNKIICSTGTFIGPENNFDYKLIPDTALKLGDARLELMMLRVWYPYLRDVYGFLAGSGARFDVIHSDKQIGELLSDGSDENRFEAMRLFGLSCRTGAEIGAKKIVLHLWGGYRSDYTIENNINALGDILEAAHKYGITVVVENIVCAVGDPLTHWNTIAGKYPEAEFIFDTRFGAFHRQLDDISSNPLMRGGRVTHMHVSDFAGPPGDFKKLRPIPMPGEGIIGDKGFARLFSSIKEIYNSSITLESPAINEDGSIDCSRLAAALDYIKKGVHQ